MRFIAFPAACALISFLVLDTACEKKPQSGAAQNPVSAESNISQTADTENLVRDPKWAVPVTAPGLTNFFQVSDELYRGAQPGPEGIAQLKKMGIKTIINLRKLHSDKDEMEEANLEEGMKRIHIGCNPWNPETEDVVAFLKAVTNKSDAPFFVHCQHGSDRTGMMVAMYRIVVQGWSKDDAFKEMKDGGYGFHSVWKDIQTYVKNVDIEKIRREAGLVQEGAEAK